jgi:hypothetical protein
VGGSTFSFNFPTMNAHEAASGGNGNEDAFVAKLFVLAVDDFDRDGKADYAGWRPLSGTCFVIPSDPSQSLVQQWNLNRCRTVSRNRLAIRELRSPTTGREPRG